MKPKNLEIALTELTSSVEVLRTLIERQWRHVKVLVPVSGGKDSQACMKLAVNEHGAENVLGLFCDTKFEHPETYAHVKRIAQLYAVQITTVSGGSVEGESIRWGRFPGGGSRHCTDYLKINQTRLFCRFLAEQQGGFEVWYGIRSDESNERKVRYAGKIDEELYAPHEVMPSKYPKYLAKMGVMFRLPVLKWSKYDIFDYLQGSAHPHYSQGFDRVGCFPCLAAGDKAKERAFAHDNFGVDQKRKVIRISQQIGRSVWTSKGGITRNVADSGCLVCSI